MFLNSVKLPNWHNNIKTVTKWLNLVVKETIKLVPMFQCKFPRIM